MVAWKLSIAMAPSAQKLGSKPSVRNTMPIISAKAVSSSTTRIFAFMPVRGPDSSSVPAEGDHAGETMAQE
ncbi:hypothetical protein GCM10027415_07330 [Humibacter ginsengisoli]